jgi:hypothetical protein
MALKMGNPPDAVKCRLDTAGNVLHNTTITCTCVYAKTATHRKRGRREQKRVGIGPKGKVMLARNIIETNSQRIEPGKGRMSTVQCEEVGEDFLIEAHHVAEYVADMLVELRDMSTKSHLNVLACLIEAARLEAEDLGQG